MNENPFKEISSYPVHVSVCGSIVRLIDTIGFRFYWATDGLTDADYAYRIKDNAPSIADLVSHLWGLFNWIHLSIHNQGFEKPARHPEQIESIFIILKNLRETFSEISDEQLESILIREKPFWHLINGPLADALTHIGQINALRRGAGNPAASLNPFLGYSPKQNHE